MPTQAELDMFKQYGQTADPQELAAAWQQLQNAAQTGDYNVGYNPGGWRLGNGYSQLERIASQQEGSPDQYRRWDTARPDGNGGFQQWQQFNPVRQDNYLSYLAPFALMAGGMAFGLPGMGGEAAASSGASAAGSVASGTGASAAGTGASAMDLNLFDGISGLGELGSSASGGLDVSGLGLNQYLGGSSGLPSWLTNLGGNLGSKALGSLAGGLLGGVNGSSQSGTATSTTRQEVDPRMAQILYGTDGKSGLLNQFAQQAGTPQSAGMQTFGNTATNFLGQNGQQSLNNMQASANALMGGGFYAPQATAASVNAPSQNGVDLKNAYNDMIYGEPGNNKYLTGMIQKGINQSTNAFGNMLQDAKNGMNDTLQGIRGGAIVNGSMGSSRQGIAEGKAFDSYNTQIGRALSQFGQNNTDAAVSAQAGAYDADRNRALSAMSGLGAQQYGVAQQDAQMQQQANMLNPQLQLQNNQLNSNNISRGLDANMNLMNNAYTYGTNQDGYNLNKLGKVSGLLSPYTGLGGSSTSSQPLYENKVNGILGGALTGAQIAGLFGKS